MKTLSVKLPEPLAKWLAGESRLRKRSRSEIVRDALERFRSGTGKTTCHDLMQDACGSFKGSPDLSTNPRHFAGFGR